MINTEQDFRDKTIRQPQVFLHEHEIEGLESIPFVQMGLTDALIVRKKADSAKRDYLSNANFDGAEYFANEEYNNKLKYWSVVYCLSVNDEPAYRVNGLNYIENYVNDFLGVKFYAAYESLALEILDSCGIELAKLSEDENEEIEDDFSVLDDGTNAY